MSLWDRIKGAFSDDAKGREAFLHAARQVAEGIPGVQVVEERPEEFVLLLRAEADESSHSFYLSNLFEETRSLPARERVARVERFLLDTIASRHFGPRAWSDVRERLVPVLRGGSNFVSGHETLPVLRRPFVPFLVEGVVIDSDAGMEYVNESEPGKWRVDAEEVFEEARRHLAACQDGIEPFGEDASSPLWHVATGDAYESSRLLLPGWLSSFEGKVKGRPVAIVPDRSTLIVGGSEDTILLERMLALAEEKAKSSPRYLSMVPYTIDPAGTIIPFEVPAGHPLVPTLRHAYHLLAGTEYRSQKDHLNALHDRDGTDIFVASYGSIRGKDGIERSYASWGEGIDSLLPKTELLAIGGDGEGSEGGKWLALVPWGDVERIASGCLSVVPVCDPPRYRTVRWPQPSQIVELRACAEATDPG
jgi:hypothetical protein